MPSLYRRLLRVFKPPSDSSDSDGHAEAVSPSVAVSSARGPFGFPVNLESSLKGSSSSKTSPATRPAAAVIQNPDMTVNAAAPSHKPPQSTGFRARLLKKLLSSPNLNTVIYPAPAAAVKPHSYSTSVGQPHRQERRHYNDSDNSTAMHSTPPSEYEHDHTCPAGQRILEARNGAQRRAVTLPRQTVPPTLQSKYGVPGRELGAGTQAQVMLLRVKSTKRARASYPLSKKTEAGSEDAAQLKEQKQKEKPVVRGSLSPDDHDRQVPVDALLTPRCRSGTMLTTTEDDVTPEQREAYRKRLLRRFSTGGASVMSNGGGVSGIGGGGLIYAIKKFRPPKATETHRQYLKKICAEFCISTSMDHENIIRTIDLVRDQPEPDHVEDDIHDQEQETRRSRGHHQGQTHADHGYDPQAQWVGHEDVKDDNHDCNCSKGYHHVRAIKSDSRLRSDSQYESSSISSSSRHSRRTAIVANPQRKRSMETHSIPRRLVGTPEPASPHAQGAQEQRSRHSMLRSQHLPHMHLHRRQNKDQTEAQMITAAKKKKQLEQELRQKEVLRLKHLKDREKQRSKQLRLNQFPEYCMVMEFAAGGDLFSLLTKTDPPISLNEKHCLWRQLVNGVQYMHSMGVAHRDLKPENILIDGTGRILKITDFGIANVFKSVGDPNPLPCKGVIGSEPYIAPEEFYLEEYDPRAVDVWACGIIFYVMYYAAMPWARADRRKDARYARFIRDITAYRYNEPYRRLQFERRMLLNASTQVSKADAGSHTGSSHTSRSTVPSAEIFDRSQEANCRRQLPPYSPEESNISAGTSSQSGSPTSLHSQDDTVSPHTSVENSPVTTKKPMPFDTAQDLTMATNCTGTTSGSGESAMSIAAPIPATVYNTYAYNGHLGGHEFIDRMENPGCRRILYAILEPDVRKRVTIEQVVKDDWVARIRHCTDCVSKQEQQAALVFGRGTSPGKYMQGYGYGTPHHQHAVPKAVKH
ncbi:serine/threonine-protein kinase HAL4/sat4 [Mortierella sp. GBA30]|nr:serine/threonine-protein kinase HAL4/sat4 [Mortierella sp. GBA30]